jgi:hypothetical protein
MVPACAVLGAAVCLLPRRCPLWLRGSAVVLVFAAVVLWFFSVYGTPAGAVGPGICGPDNVPPWWPDWLPA